MSICWQGFSPFSLHCRIIYYWAYGNYPPYPCQMEKCGTNAFHKIIMFTEWIGLYSYSRLGCYYEYLPLSMLSWWKLLRICAVALLSWEVLSGLRYQVRLLKKHNLHVFIYNPCNPGTALQFSAIHYYLTRLFQNVRNATVFPKFRHIFGPPKLRSSL